MPPNPHADPHGDPRIISIIICTRDRAGMLDATLEALGRLEVAPEREVEILVVDNGSTDATPEVVRRHAAVNPRVRWISEPRPGQSHARNTGLAQSRGAWIVFTDDDVVPEPNWLERLVAPLRAGSCDATAGATRLAADRLRIWMTIQHRLWLAEEFNPPGERVQLIGANMAFARHVLTRVPAFDTDLGPGALGFSDDELFSFQLYEAGYRIRYVPEALVTHHPDVTRLQRAQWLSAARKRGQSVAYMMHHWEHDETRWPRLRAAVLTVALILRGAMTRGRTLANEGCPAWELSYTLHREKWSRLAALRRLPRHYTRHGLCRLAREAAPAHSHVR